MTKERSAQNGRLSTPFFEQLFQIARQFSEQDFLDQFNQFKSQRDHYLQEWWTDEIQNKGNEVFREVDYDYFITTLRESLSQDVTALNEAQLQIAEVCLQFGEFYKSSALLSHLEKTTDRNNKKQLARVLMLRGLLKGQTNNWQESQQHYAEALEILEEIGDQAGIAYVYNNLGILASEQWDTEQGVDYFTKARQLVEGDEGYLPQNVSMNLAVIQGIRGESEDAIRVFDALLNDIESEDHRTRINILINKGVAAKDRSDYELAKSMFTQAYDEAVQFPNKRLVGLACLGLADVHIRENEFDTGKQKAIEAFKIFSQLHDRMSLADVYREFGMLHRERQLFDLAESQLQISIRMNTEYGNLLNLAESHYEYGVLMKQKGNTAEHRDHLEKARSYFEQMRAPRRVERVQQELNSLS